MPPKRGALQSPNPIKHALFDEDNLDHSDINGVANEFAIAESANTEAPIVAANVSPSPQCHAVSSGSSAEAQIVADNVISSPQFHAVSSGSFAEAPIVVATVISSPQSPNKNRDRFLHGFTPARTCCNLDLCRAPAGSKFNLSAICIAAFPASKNPDRRYIMLADSTGSVGVTVWNENVNKFGSGAVGKLICVSKVVIISHHGKKQLSLVRDSSIQIVDDETHDVVVWWKLLLRPVPVTCGAVHDIADNHIVSVSGICGRISSEIKMVNGVERTITTIHLVDGCGRCDVKTWNHLPKQGSRKLKGYLKT